MSPSENDVVNKSGIKPTQILGWDSEPKIERQSSPGADVAAAQRSEKPGARPEATADWAAQRQAPNERDRSLSFVAIGWLQKLAPADRPSRLCALYPRVANRIALCWPDAALTRSVLEGLLVDKRGTRKGFPAPVMQELVRLRHMRTPSEGG